jgi:hypothetical protein
MLNEELILFLWRQRLYDASALRTTDGRPVEVVSPGTRQYDAGPDLADARLRIDGTLWAGSIEVHVRSSDWLRHGHQNDPRYANIILHLVFNHDTDVPLGAFPTVELAPVVSDQILHRHARLMHSRDAIPCGATLATVPHITVSTWLERLLIGRMEARASRIEALIGRCGGDLEQAFQAWIFRYMGAKVNDDAFEELGLALPWKVMGKGRNDIMLTEALLFGTAGLLPDPPVDDHSSGLLREYRYLAHANGLKPMAAHRWRFARLRPAAFPTVRISQLAAIVHRHGPLLQAISGCAGPADVRALLGTVASGYWTSRFRFGEVSTVVRPKALGHDAIDSIIINAVVPFLFVRHDRSGRYELKEQVLGWLNGLGPEDNRTVRGFMALGLRPADAAQTQALLTLRHDYCDRRNCLHCAIGTTLLRT